MDLLINFKDMSLQKSTNFIFLSEQLNSERKELITKLEHMKKKYDRKFDEVFILLKNLKTKNKNEIHKKIQRIVY